MSSSLVDDFGVSGLNGEMETIEGLSWMRYDA
jgi:hypothetical protein